QRAQKWTLELFAFQRGAGAAHHGVERLLAPLTASQAHADVEPDIAILAGEHVTLEHAELTAGAQRVDALEEIGRRAVTQRLPIRSHSRDEAGALARRQGLPQARRVLSQYIDAMLPGPPSTRRLVDHGASQADELAQRVRG